MCETKANTMSPCAYLRRLGSLFDCVFVRPQLQNSRMVIQERDRVIKDLEEKVAFLEAEVRSAYGLPFYGMGFRIKGQG